MILEFITMKMYISLNVILQINKRQRTTKGQSKKDNPEKLATYRVHKTKKNKTKTQHYISWTPQYENSIT